MKKIDIYDLAPYFVLIITAASFFFTWNMLNQTSYANGIDGYYYAGQVKFFKLDHTFKIPESSPVLYLLVLVSLFFKNDVLAVKFGASLLSSLMVPAGYLAAKEIFQSRASGLGMALLVFISGSLIYFAVEFLKNLGAMLFFFIFLYFLAKFVHARRRHGSPDKKVLFFLFLFGLLALLSHRFTTILVPALLVLVLFPGFLAKSAGEKLRILFFFCLVLAVIAVMKRFWPGIGGIHPRDLDRFAGEFDSGFHAPLMSGYYKRSLSAPLYFELGLYFFLPYIAIIFYREMGPVLRSLLVLLLFMFHPFWNTDILGMGFRIFLNGALLVPFLAVFLFGRIVPEKCQEKLCHINTFFTLVLIAAFFYHTQIREAIYNPGKDPPYAQYAKIITMFSLPRDSLLICHKGLSLFYTYTTERDGLNFVPEYSMEKEKLWRLSYFVDFGKYRKYIPEEVQRGNARELDFPYQLVREDAWQKFIKRIPPYLRESYLNEYNPYQTRPDFLRVHHPSFGKSNIKYK